MPCVCHCSRLSCISQVNDVYCLGRKHRVLSERILFSCFSCWSVSKVRLPRLLSSKQRKGKSVTAKSGVYRRYLLFVVQESNLSGSYYASFRVLIEQNYLTSFIGSFVPKSLVNLMLPNQMCQSYPRKLINAKKGNVVWLWALNFSPRVSSSYGSWSYRQHFIIVDN